MLAQHEFLEIVRLTPLVSIDLIVLDQAGDVLLGRRVNRPAQGMWFVPGGRIRKDETLADAFKRIVRDELGPGVDPGVVGFKGVFEHRYDDNFAGAEHITTHYVVLAYTLKLDAPIPAGRFEQHSDYAWMSPAEALASPGVHENTKAYFR